MPTTPRIKMELHEDCCFTNVQVARPKSSWNRPCGPFGSSNMVQMHNLIHTEGNTSV